MRVQLQISNTISEEKKRQNEKTKQNRNNLCEHWKLIWWGSWKVPTNPLVDYSVSTSTYTYTHRVLNPENYPASKLSIRSAARGYSVSHRPQSSHG